MRVRGYELTYPRLLLVGVVLVTSLTLVFAVGTSSSAFGSYNYGWDGTSELRTTATESGADIQVGRSTTAYRDRDGIDATDATAFVIRPTRPYTEGETEPIREFLDNGGTVVVGADDSAAPNQLLAELGAESRFDGRQLRDNQRYYLSPALPVASNVEESPLTQDVSQLTLNHATAIEAPENGTTIVRSSGFAYMDTNANGELDDWETMDRRPVVVSEDVGAGRLILVGDASVFINAMLDRPDNQQFTRNVLTDSEVALLDYSHREGLPIAIEFVLLAAGLPIVQALPVVVLAVVAGAIWVGLPTRPDRKREDLPGGTEPTDASYEITVSRIADRYPEWSDERVKRVAKSITRDANIDSDG
jgi:hypothetical protein